MRSLILVERYAPTEGCCAVLLGHSAVRSSVLAHLDAQIYRSLSIVDSGGYVSFESAVDRAYDSFYLSLFDHTRYLSVVIVCVLIVDVDYIAGFYPNGVADIVFVVGWFAPCGSHACQQHYREDSERVF